MKISNYLLFFFRVERNGRHIADAWANLSIGNDFKLTINLPNDISLTNET